MNDNLYKAVIFVSLLLAAVALIITDHAWWALILLVLVGAL